MKDTLKDIGGIALDLIITIFVAIIALNIIGSILVSTAMGAEFVPHDEEIVALTLLGEARGEGEAGLYAVACVIQKRAMERDKRCDEVVLENKMVKGRVVWQFSCWADKPYMNTMKRLLKANTEQAKYSKKLAHAICRGYKLDQNFTGNANHYHASRVSPYWTKGQTPTKRIKNHIFYKLPYLTKP